MRINRISNLIVERAKVIGDLPQGVLVKARWLGIRLEISLCNPDGSDRTVEPIGYIGIVPHTEGYGGAYEVLHSFATHGWGPFLYDIALEYAGEYGMISDQRQSSPSAQAVWEYYKRNRSDVEQKLVSKDEWSPEVVAIVKRNRPTIEALKAAGKWLT